jgi:hypothetical protein
MLALIPFLGARVGDIFFHPDIRYQFPIARGFLFVATGNEDTQRDRVRLPAFVLSQFRQIEITNPNRPYMEKLISQIIEADYPNAKRIGVAPASICMLIEALKTILNVTWSLRAVRRFLRRVNDFACFRSRDSSLPASVKEISVTDVALSFILSLLRKSLSDDRWTHMIAETVTCFGGSRSVATEFAEGKTQYQVVFGKHYLVRSHVALPVEKPANFPQPVLDTLFWMRWSVTPVNQGLSENILLVGPTCYKSLALDYLMPKLTNVYDMSRETQISEFIGSTILSTSARIEEDIAHLRLAASNALKQWTSFDVNRPGPGVLAKELEAEFLKQKESKASDAKHCVELDVLGGSWFVHLSLK